MTYFVNFAEMTTEELREEFCRMKTEILTLTKFLVANFGNEIGLEEAVRVVNGEAPALVAVRLLAELVERRRQVEALRAERQAMSAECLEEARQLTSFVNHLNKGEPNG